MGSRTLATWLERGNRTERFAKWFALGLLLAAIALAAVHGLAVFFHWDNTLRIGIFAPRPFVSGFFWFNCTVYALLSAVRFTFWPSQKDSIPRRT